MYCTELVANSRNLKLVGVVLKRVDWRPVIENF